MQANFYLVHEGEPIAAPLQEPGYNYWLLCLAQTRARSEFDRSWRFRPIATYQPGSAEFIAEYEATAPQRVLVYDRVFGSPTYLSVLGIYELAELTPQGTRAGALLYAAQLRQVAGFSKTPQLDPHHNAELWNQLDFAQQPTDWDALLSKERVLLPLSDQDYQRILAQADYRIALPSQPSLELASAETISPGAVGTRDPDLNVSLVDALAITTKPSRNVTETECYHLLRVLERAL